MARRSRLSLIIAVFTLMVGLILGSYISEVRYREEKRRIEIELAEKDGRIKELSNLVELLQNWLKGNITFYREKIVFLEEYTAELRKQLNIEILGIYFSPKGGCKDTLISWINRANISIHILIYSFTLDQIGEALIEAYRRGIDIKVVFEKDQVTKDSEYWRLKEAGIPVRNDTNPRLMHNKIMIVDGEVVITGSYNWSKSAEEWNNENLIVIKSRDVAKIYEEEFERIWSESV